MAHKTLIGGTAYEVSGGKTLIGGTAYSIAGGKTLVGGTGYDISFKPEPLDIFNSSGFVNGFSMTVQQDSYGYDCASVQGSWIWFYKDAYGNRAAIDIQLPSTVVAGYTKLYWTGYAYQSNPSGGAGTDAKYGIAKCDQARSGNWYNPSHNMRYYNSSDGYGTTWVSLQTGVSLTSTTYSLDISSVAGQDYAYFAMCGPGGNSGYATNMRVDKIWLE